MLEDIFQFEDIQNVYFHQNRKEGFVCYVSLWCKSKEKLKSIICKIYFISFHTCLFPESRPIYNLQAVYVSRLSRCIFQNLLKAAHNMDHQKTKYKKGIKKWHGRNFLDCTAILQFPWKIEFPMFYLEKKIRTWIETAQRVRKGIDRMCCFKQYRIWSLIQFFTFELRTSNFIPWKKNYRASINARS